MNEAVEFANLDLNYEAAVLVETSGMEEKEWLNWRRKGIGGSDAAAVLGVSPYKTSRDVYYEKIGRQPDHESNDGWVALEVGKRLEDLVAEIFAKKTGFRVWKEEKMFQHPLYPFMLADVDYFFETPDGEVGILECKTANIYAKEKWENDSVPYHYEMQCRHYMAVKNLHVCYIACLFGNSENDFVYRRIERDLDFELSMIEEEEIFWENCVQKEVEPPMHSDGDLALASLRRYQSMQQKRNELVLESEYSEALEQILLLRAEKATADKTSRELEKKIKNTFVQFAELLGNTTHGRCTAVDGSEYLITYKPTYRTGINKENLEKMQLNDAEIYRKYATTTESRPFQIKKIMA